MISALVVVIVCFLCANGQTLNGAYVKYDYCVKGSSSCKLPNCGNTASNFGWCIGEGYILLSNCTSSGLGVNQPAPDPAVISLYQCNGNGGLRTNYSSLSDCQNSSNPLQPIQTPFNSLGYSSFCWGGPVSLNSSPFGQFDMKKGYYVETTFFCPSGLVTKMIFFEDPSPQKCVSNNVNCSGISQETFVVSTTCFLPTSDAFSVKFSWTLFFIVVFCLLF